MGLPRGTHSRYLIGCCLIPLGICGLKNNSRRITYRIGCVWRTPSLSPLSSLTLNSTDSYNQLSKKKKCKTSILERAGLRRSIPLLWRSILHCTLHNLSYILWLSFVFAFAIHFFWFQHSTFIYVTFKFSLSAFNFFIKKKSIKESIKLLMNSDEYHHRLWEETGYERQLTNGQNMKYKNNVAAVSVGCSMKVHNTLFSVDKLWPNWN